MTIIYIIFIIFIEQRKEKMYELNENNVKTQN